MSELTAHGAGNNPSGGANGSESETTAKFEHDELVAGWRAYASRLPNAVPVLKYAPKTDMGQVRENNEDKFDYYEPEDPPVLAARGSLFAVADGIGGAQAGQIASEMMLKNLITQYYNHPASEPESALREVVRAVNDRIFQLGQMILERNGMGTTLTGAVFLDNRVLIVQVGDSRAYLIREGAVRQVTRDHSWVEEQVSAGLMSRNDAESSPFRNVITRSIGASPSVEPDIYREECRPGDVWVLCSDGLSGYVSAEEIGRIAGSHPPSEAARQFIEIANARGGRDNITAFVISVRDVIALSSDSPSGDALATETEDTAAPGPSSSISQRESESGQPSQTNGETAPAAFSEPVPAIGGGTAQTAPRTGWRRMFGR